MSGTLKKILLRGIMRTSCNRLIAISTTPRDRVPDRDMDIGERTPPRASDMKSFAWFTMCGAPPYEIMNR
jgi:hypothetical protein